MFYIFLFLVVGVTFGFTFRSDGRLAKFADSMFPYAVYFLLLSLGASFSLNGEVAANIRNLGASALLIASFAIAGSVVAVNLVAKFLLKDGGRF